MEECSILRDPDMFGDCLDLITVDEYETWCRSDLCARDYGFEITPLCVIVQHQAHACMRVGVMAPEALENWVTAHCRGEGWLK